MSWCDRLRQEIMLWMIVAMALVGCNAVVWGQSRNMNYIRVVEAKTASKLAPPVFGDISDVKVIYYDGLGREIETVDVFASPNGYDIARFTEYDRTMEYRNLPSREYLPVETAYGDGQFVGVSGIIDYAEEQYGDSRPYTETIYESNATARPVSVRGPGEAWRSHPVDMVYSFNSLSGPYSCLLFKLNADEELENCGTYPANRLKVTRTVNEDDNESYVFTDKRGRTVLERRVVAESIYADTYYAYDVYGDLRYMISPEGAARITTVGVCDKTVLADYCYQYRYDERHRLIERKLPGCEAEYFVYDKMDRIVYSQNGDDRVKSSWASVKYDDKGRKAIEGLTKINNPEKMGEAGRKWLQSQCGRRLVTETAEPERDADGALFYTNTEPYGTFSPRIAYFYDDYSHWCRAAWSDDLPFDTQDYPADSCLLDATGLLTGTAVANNGQVWITATIYDRDRNPIVEVSQEYGEGYTYYTLTARDFRGLPLRVKHKLYYFDSKSKPPISDETQYVYGNGDRIIEVRHRVGSDGTWRLLKQNSYDFANRLQNETFTGIYSTDYSYNVRGQITGISGSLFRQNLYYGENPFGGVSSYGGNVSATEVSSLDMAGGSASLSMCGLSYTYDGLGRLVEAAEGTAGDVGDAPYRESYSYDLNTNVSSMEKTIGGELWDDVTFRYKGNRLVGYVSRARDSRYSGRLPKIPFNTDEFGTMSSVVAYDGVGRLVKDEFRGIDTLKYMFGHFQPFETRFSNGDYMRIYRRADGVKVSEFFYLRYAGTVEDTSGHPVLSGDDKDKLHTVSRYYYGNIVQELESGSKIRYRIYNDVGYVLYDPYAGTYDYRYYLRDNLGSVRVEVDGEGEVVRGADYSSTGVPMERRWRSPSGLELYGGKQYYGIRDLGWYDNSARTLESVMQRFTSMDPLCEKYPAVSPYAYCAGNPLRYIDPDGKDVYELTQNGRIKKRYENADYDQFVIVQGNKKIYSQQYEYGTVEFYDSDLTSNYKPEGENSYAEYDKYIISNESAADGIFDFLTDNIPSEFSKTSYNDNNNNKAVIATGGLEDAEPGLTMVLDKMFEDNTVINSITHNHPSLQKGASSEDIKFKQLFLQKYLQDNLPDFYLLHSQKGVPKTLLEY